MSVGSFCSVEAVASTMPPPAKGMAYQAVCRVALAIMAFIMAFPRGLTRQVDGVVRAVARTLASEPQRGLDLEKREFGFSVLDQSANV